MEQTMKPRTAALIVALTLAGMLAVALLSGCASKPISTPTPEYAAVGRKIEDVGKTISSVQSDSKEVKELQRDSMSLLDRLDYKTTILLQQ